MGETQAQKHAADGIADAVADVAKQVAIKFLKAAGFIFHPGRCHFFQHIGVAANRTLTKDHHAAGQYIGTLNSNPHRRAHPATAKVVARTHDDTFASQYIHTIGNHLAGVFGRMVLGNR